MSKPLNGVQKRVLDALGKIDQRLARNPGFNGICYYIDEVAVKYHYFEEVNCIEKLMKRYAPLRVKIEAWLDGGEWFGFFWWEMNKGGNQERRKFIEKLIKKVKKGRCKNYE